MTAAPMIQVEHLSKRYSTGLHQSLRRGVNEIVREVSGRRAERRDPLRAGEFLALDDVSFTVDQGDAYGIMGLNGAGKSTLLRVLSGITRPDAGTAEVRGRVGVLLDPMGGFDPLLTGRENARASCLLWHVSDAHMGPMLDEIIEFAEIGDFIDSPVRTYSKGMRMRLSFAVSIQHQPDVLLIDETLAVGDVRFQQKCEARIHRYLADGGTLVVVSHSVNAIQGMCSKCLVLERGRVEFDGAAVEAVQRYTELVALSEQMEPTQVDELAALDAAAERIAAEGSEALDAADADDSADDGADEIDPFHGRSLSFSHVSVVGPDGGPPVTGHPAHVAASYVSREEIPAADWGIQLVTPDGLSPIAADVTEGDEEQISISPGRGQLSAVFPRFPLMAGSYMLRIAVIDRSTTMTVGLHGFDTPATFFTVDDPDAQPAFVDDFTAPPLVDLGRVEWSVFEVASPADG
jgi:ABC-type polysaccharide/polyol phosphate transport system ATPase subunit